MKVCATSGTVHAVRMNTNGKTADLTIHHGDAPKSTKADPFPERAQTTHTIAAKHAAQFPVGKSVKMTLSTEPDADDQDADATGSSSSIGKGFAAGKAKAY